MAITHLGQTWRKFGIARQTCRKLITTCFFLVCLAVQMHSTHSFSMKMDQYDPNMKTKIASSVAKTERRIRERSRVGREICDRCNRPPPLCVCQSLPEKLIETSTSVLILQHPRERRRKSLSTVPLMPLCLKKCTVKVGYNFTPQQLDLVTECLGSQQKPLLLFPGPDAITLDDDSNAGIVQNLQEKGQLLILIDGTWAEAKRMIMQSPELIKNCQQVQFQSESESIYHTSSVGESSADPLRKEPEKHCLSTLESSAQALMHLEPSVECAMEAKMFLEGSMRCMVEKRMSVSEERNREPRFARPGMKIYEKNKRRHEIKKQLFN